LRSLLLFTFLFQIAGAQTPARLAGQIATAHQAGEFDGVVVLSQNGKVVSTSALGFSDRYSQTPLHPETIFRLASLTKQVTALLVMQEVSAGRLTLDRKTGEILTSLPNSAARVTVRQLLQHVSGLPTPVTDPKTKSRLSTRAPRTSIRPLSNSAPAPRSASPAKSSNTTIAITSSSALCWKQPPASHSPPSCKNASSSRWV